MTSSLPMVNALTIEKIISWCPLLRISATSRTGRDMKAVWNRRPVASWICGKNTGYMLRSSPWDGWRSTIRNLIRGIHRRSHEVASHGYNRSSHYIRILMETMASKLSYLLKIFTV